MATILVGSDLRWSRLVVTLAGPGGDVLVSTGGVEFTLALSRAEAEHLANELVAVLTAGPADE